MKTHYSTMFVALATLVFSVPAAAHDCSRHSDPNHKHCAVEGPSVVYEAELQGAFVFGPLPVTLEGQDDRLRAAVDAIMTRADSTQPATWDNVFSMPDPEPCDLFGSPGAVLSFTALKKQKQVKGWRISRPGGVYVQFGGQLLTDSGSAAGGALVDVGLQLRGNCEYSGGTDLDCDPFLPDPTMDYGDGPGISKISLTVFQIHAKALKGSPQFEGCHTAQANLLVPSTLVITATTP